MRLVCARKDLSKAILSFKKDGKTIGFVPTMGALHDGHISLIHQAQKDNDVTVVSIFVNPLQFNNANDLATYPRVLEVDIEKLEESDVDLVFAPKESELYPTKPTISIDFGRMAKVLEGKFRKGHFAGVGIVVSKLLHLVQPDRVYFGLKDLQQYLLIRKMCQDLNFPCDVIGVDTVREASGLALSSRNSRLSKDGLQQALVISRGLSAIEAGIVHEEPLGDLLLEARKLYKESPGFELEYLEAVNPKDLTPVTRYDTLDELAVCVAGYVEGVRLIDNLYLRLKE